MHDEPVMDVAHLGQGLGHVGFRTRSLQALDRRVAALHANGHEVWAHAGELGHGMGFRDPDAAVTAGSRRG